MPERVKIYREKKSGTTAKDIMKKYNLKNIGVVHNLMTLTKPKGAKAAAKVAGKRGPGRPKGSKNKTTGTKFPEVRLGEVDRLRTENSVLRAILESVPQVKQ